MNNRPLFAWLLVSLFVISGCGNPVLDDPPVSERELRTVETLQLEPAANQPTTLPYERTSSTQPSTAQPAGREVGLAIEEARAFALMNNLELKISIINPSIARNDVSEAESQFEWLFTTGLGYTNADNPTATRLEGSQTQGYTINPALEIPLRTGGRISLGLPISQSETNNEFATLNPSWGAEAEATLSHPLLRNAGPDVTLRALKIASLNYLASEARAKLELIRILTLADRLYWRLYAARQALIVRQKEYDLAVAQLERAERQARIGVVAEVEVIRAESGVADTREAIITSENAVRDTERDLKRIMNQPGLEIESDVVVVPTTAPRVLYYRVEPHVLIEQALSGRMEMLEQELVIMQDAINVGFARNQMLPLVSLTYTYGVPGLGGSFNDAIAMVDDNDFNSHRAGLQIEVPLGNEGAKAGLRSALLVRMQNLLTREQRALQIKQETLVTIDALNTNWYRIIAARKRVEAASRVYEAEVRQFNQGIRTSTDVLIAQNNLAAAALAELSAIADYQISQTDIAQATGTVLGQTKVSWSPATQPAPR